MGGPEEKYKMHVMLTLHICLAYLYSVKCGLFELFMDSNTNITLKSLCETTKHL